MYYVYFLKSSKDGKLYIGISNNPERRLHQHNSGNTKSTKHRTPFELIYKESFENRVQARSREKFLKSYSGAKEKTAIVKDLNIGD